MCGIGGVLRVWKSAAEAPPSTLDAIPEAWLDVLDESVRHRGPDGFGRFRQRIMRASGEIVDIALIHRRLSIIDHIGGVQPMVIGAPLPPRSSERAAPVRERSFPFLDTPAVISREGARYEPVRAQVCSQCGPGVAAVVFNGCIYNHRELRRELEAVGHEFFTDHSDTEVLLHGWREWGAEVQNRIEGMFAWLVWDAGSGVVVAARDAFGEKPLCILDSEPSGFVVFASVPAALSIIASGEGHDALSADALCEWIRFGYHARRTPFEALRLAPHACLMSVHGALQDASAIAHRRLGPGRVGRFKRSLPVPGPSRETEDRIEALLREAVRGRLEADVAVGCLLSGGVDSSLVAKFANEAMNKAPLTTICVRMPDDRYDESNYARTVAARLGTRHLTIDAHAQPADDLVTLITTIGLPFGDSSLLPTYWACRAAADEVGVLLSGDGGDEMFLGYERYVSAKFLELPAVLSGLSPLLCPLVKGLPRQNPKSIADKAARFLLAGLAGSSQAYRELLAIFPRADADRLMDRPGRAMDLESAQVPGPLDAREYDLEHHLPGDLLLKVDTASMAAGVELRSPFLDSALARTALALPVQRLMPRGQRKGLLRAVARRYLPAEIVDRPKMGFAIPIGEWFRTDYGGMRQLLYDHLESTEPFPGLAEAGIELNLGFVRRMLREHDAAGEKSINPWHGRDHSQRLYMLLVLSVWCGWLQGVRGGG
ncbi:MAG: asparagine synthase (glutamine-hydrolyzing) [Leptolyngbya sp. PLA2]|nr:asparagine synthase (glutamine-hydrolyzing) [Leptolyngbya sp. PL-A2]MCQ3940108.1 asparagine synthase (glutamine-hydrolyzing) [cyanobacterium CYA1]MCZ7632771.1 asparagine synthase (glutamine-hydrolyzing) [Phycisphaerales bacterium]MDL1904155.1 asparagine synthase (glutamine-hydrolyzing) [Synechococcales cyanobacterium CNB]GIK19156.1 MAG: asparagine synthetase B [Planctomycetota bacterium]